MNTAPESEQAEAVRTALEEGGVIPARPKAKPAERRFRAAQKKPNGPAELAPVVPPKAVLEALNVWWVNGSDRYLRMPVAGDESVEKWTERQLARELRIEGVTNEKGKLNYSPLDLALRVMTKERRVEYAGEIAGYPVGICEMEGKRVAVTASFRLILPEPGEWRHLQSLLESRFGAQISYFYAWCKMAYSSLAAGEMQPGHLLILTGGSNAGKSLIQEHVITPLLGGRASDPMPYLLGKTQFTSSVTQKEHLMIQEMPSGVKPGDRARIGEELKKLLVNESLELHVKYCDPIMVRPWRRVTLSINDDLDRLQTLPEMTPDFVDKVLLLKLEGGPMPMPDETFEERKAFRAVLRSEMPAFIAHLVSWRIPEELRKTENARRFGFDSWRDAEISADIAEGEDVTLLIWALDGTPALYEGSLVNDDLQAVGWLGLEEVREKLLAGPCSQRIRPAVEKYPQAFSHLMGKARKLCPGRVERKKTNRHNLWLVRPPAVAAQS